MKKLAYFYHPPGTSLERNAPAGSEKSREVAQAKEEEGRQINS